MRRRCVAALACLATAPVHGKLLFGQVPRQRAVELMLRAHPELSSELEHGDIYEFGVFTGGGLRAWVERFRSRGVRFGRLWGFDSFAGLPSIDNSTVDEAEQRILAGKVPAVAPGQLNALQRFVDEGHNVTSYPALRREILRIVGYNRTHLIRGFFNESLPRLPVATRRRMRRAFLVDFDGDFYSSTIGPWAWMLDECLIGPGTFVYYDDLQICGLKSQCGEIRAHQEVSARHNITWEQMRWRDARGKPALPVVFRLRTIESAAWREACVRRAHAAVVAA